VAGSVTRLDSAVRRIAGTARLLVALDFDGTLAPTVDRPEDARATPAAAEALARLASAENTTLALISGRALASLRHVSAAPDSALLIGSHGSEFARAGTASAPAAEPLDDAERALLHDLFRILTGVVGAVDGAWLEEKPAGFALHTRLVTPERAGRAQLLARQGTEPLNGLTVRAGKDVLEFSVRSATKGDAIQRLRREAHPTATFFAGDDTTDEDAFALLGADDVGVKVGRGQTAAAYRVDNPERLAEVLGLLADLRSGRGTGEDGDPAS
jgi:trehalose 6-phosphate phosphatase